MAYAEQTSTPLYRDERFLRIINQVVVVALVAVVLVFSIQQHGDGPAHAKRGADQL